MCPAVQTMHGPPGEKRTTKLGPLLATVRDLALARHERMTFRSFWIGRSFFGDEQAQDPERWQEGLSKGNGVLQKGGFRACQLTKVGKDFHQNKGREMDQKEIGKEGTHPQSGFSASETHQ